MAEINIEAVPENIALGSIWTLHWKPIRAVESGDTVVLMIRYRPH